MPFCQGKQALSRPPPVHASATPSPGQLLVMGCWVHCLSVTLMWLPLCCHQLLGRCWSVHWFHRIQLRVWGFSPCYGIVGFLRLDEPIEDNHWVAFWAREGHFGCMITCNHWNHFRFVIPYIDGHVLAFETLYLVSVTCAFYFLLHRVLAGR